MESRTSKVFSLSFAQILLVCSGLISGMVFTRVLTTTDYATYLQTFLAYDFAVPLLSLGLPSALYYFLAGNPERQKGLVIDNLFLLFLVAILFSFFLIGGGTDLLSKRFNNPDIVRTLKWMIWYPLYTLPVLLAPAVWITKGKAQLNAVFNMVTGIVSTILLIVSVLLFKDYEAPVLVRIIFPAIVFPIYLFFIFRYVPGEWHWPRLKSMWAILKFSIPLGLASVFGTLAIQLANLIVSALTSPEAYAVYAVGAKEIPLIGTITGSIAVVILADMATKIKDNQIKEALALFNKASLISACFLFPIMCFLMVHAQSFIVILYSEKYIDSVVPFRIYLLVIPVRIAYYGSAFIAFGKSKLILMRSLGDLLITGLLCYIFVSILGENGAALGLLVTLFVWTVPFNLMTLRKYFDCQFSQILPFPQLFRVFFISIFSALISTVTLLLQLNLIVKFLISGSIFVLLYVLLAKHYISEFNYLYKSILKKIRT